MNERADGGGDEERTAAKRLQTGDRHLEDLRLVRGESRQIGGHRVGSTVSGS